MSVLEEVQQRLLDAFKPEVLEVTDESHLHRGHVGHRPGVVTHLRVRILTDQFDGQPRLAQHRAINAALFDLMNNPIHALAIETR